MPLQMASELRFPMGSTVSLSDQSLNDFMSLIRKLSGDMDRQRIIEVFKQHFCKVSGDNYNRSSSLSWAESDMSSQAMRAAEDAPNFIAAVYEAFEALQNSGVTVPTIQHINQILRNNQDNYQIIDYELIATSGSVAAPEISESVSNSVMRALGDAKALIGTVDSSSAIDRAHTALHGYLVQLCTDNQALSEEVERDSQSGTLSQELLSQGQTLYGTSPVYPDFLIRTTPNGQKSVGRWQNGEFIEKVCLLY